MKICQPRSRCRNWRICNFCAALRQAKIADCAERLAQISSKNDWTTLHPLLPGKYGIDMARAEWQKIHRPSAAIWTVEQTKSTRNLHINILHPSFPEKNLTHSHSHSQRINGNIRHVAAYTSKRNQAPDPSEYTGHAFGTCGIMWQHLSSTNAPPALRAAAVQWMLDPLPMIDAATAPPPTLYQIDDNTPEHYRAIAAKYLPDILARVAQF